ncbi:hypothetical protein EI94DRAFT_1695832 [Lactarius quietus]|nr:hypothetical protein EI94DRAFT_1695832 [Lactarius quietus]
MTTWLGVASMRCHRMVTQKLPLEFIQNKDAGNIYQTMVEGRGSGEDLVMLKRKRVKQLNHEWKRLANKGDNFREEGINDNDDEGSKVRTHVPHDFTQSLNFKKALNYLAHPAA